MDFIDGRRSSVVVLVVCSDLVVFYARKIGHLKYGLS